MTGRKSGRGTACSDDGLGKLAAVNPLAQRPFQRAPAFDGLAIDTDLDFTSTAESAQGFDVVALRHRGPAAGNRVVLVVDGDGACGEHTAALLREAGHHAVFEGSPRDAARHMERLGAPAMLLLEADLPQMSGFEFVERLRRNRHLKDTLAIFFTARASRADVVRGLEAGADGYITKSSGASALLAAVGKMLES